MRRKILDFMNNQIEVLKIPWYPQQDIEWMCMVNSIKMCLEYMKNTYNDRIIRDILPNMSIEGIIFSLEEEVNMNELSMKIEKGIPSIILYNCQFLTYGIRGAGHAGVVIGITKNYIIINNPWLGSEYFISHEDFAPAWELEYNQAILLEPHPQSKLGREEK